MIDQIRRVADLRVLLANLVEDKKRSMASWEQENQPLMVAIKTTSELLAEAEALLRAAAIAEYLATGNKAPAPGVAIRLMTRLTYEVKQALKWATEHGVALKLDVSTFEKMAKASPIDCVTFSEEPMAIIAIDLGKVLASHAYEEVANTNQRVHFG